MPRFFALVSALLFFCCFSTAGCSQPALAPSGPQQAQLDSQMSVALVSDFGAQDSEHLPFCSGVWVSPTTILTAAHCVQGYAYMKHRMLVAQALIDSGMPPMLARLLSSIDLEDVNPNDPEIPAILSQALKIMATIPPVPEPGLDVPYIVAGQVVDNATAPTGFQHTSAVFIDHQADLALLKTVGFVPPHLSAQAAAHFPLVGADVTSIGTVRGNYFTFRKETVAAYRHSEKNDGMKDIDGPFLQLSGAKISHGDSGSGIFNTQGQLVGLVSFVDAEADATYCIHLETIRRVMIGQRLLQGKIDVTAQDPDLTEAPLNLE